MYNLSTNNRGVPIGGSSTMCDEFRQISLPLATTHVIVLQLYHLSEQAIYLYPPEATYWKAGCATKRALIPNILKFTY
jgi:hypothetical protein